jgi:hypothetical protein
MRLAKTGLLLRNLYKCTPLDSHHFSLVAAAAGLVLEEKGFQALDLARKKRGVQVVFGGDSKLVGLARIVYTHRI